MVGFIRSFTQNADTGSDLDSIRALSKKERRYASLFAKLDGIERECAADISASQFLNWLRPYRIYRNSIRLVSVRKLAQL